VRVAEKIEGPRWAVDLLRKRGYWRRGVMVEESVLDQALDHLDELATSEGRAAAWSAEADRRIRALRWERKILAGLVALLVAALVWVLMGGARV
jgi:hypothetical protein